jgi:uncharacterized phage protein gp47/JayE
VAQINESGAVKKTLQEYKSEIEAAFLAIDPAWNITPESPDGQAIAIWAEALANADEQLLYAYQSIDPLTAVGSQLDRLGFLSGSPRQGPTQSTATVRFTGIDDTIIPAGTEVLNEAQGTTWLTDNAVTITGGEVLVNVTCSITGPQPANVGDLSSTSVSGVTAVTNDEAASLGRDNEPDEVYRIRRHISVANPGNNQLDSMISKIGNVDGVKRVHIIENFTDIADSNGVAPHSLAIFVDGGSNANIAAAMASAKNPGCGLNAASGFANIVTVETLTPNGKAFIATFFRPVYTTIYIDVEIVGSGIDEDDVKEAIVNYANATLFNTESLGFDRTGFEIGEVVSAGNLFTPVNSVVGSKGYVSSILISEDEYDITYNIVDVDFNGLGVFDVANINVTISEP